MKTFYKTLMLGVFMAALAVVSPTFAQDVCEDFDANAALYQKFTENFRGEINKTTLAARKTAVAAAKEYVEKYEKCGDFAPQVTYLKKNGPELDTRIKAFEAYLVQQERYERFDKAVQSGNTAEIFASGEDILKYEPEFIDVRLVMASVGLDEAADKQNDTFNNKTIEHAKTAIQKLEGGAKSEKFGAFAFVYNTRENAIGWMNYTIGYIEYYRQKKEESGLSYLYKATQVNSDVKDRAFIYTEIGDKYIAQADKLRQETVAIIKAENKETFESKSKLALSKGYVDRAIEAYAKGYEVAKADMNKETKADVKAQKKEYVDSLFDTLKNLYRFRFETDDKPMNNDAELVKQLNSHIASVVRKPLPSPTSEVKPVDPPSEEENTSEDTSTSSTTKTIPAKATTNGSTNKANSKPKKR
jgi:hypothetical protein